ncbi:alkanesulfonate monooxygenase SsuD/methylene tetrahydromethanopterin reductase-like flavin-dependent oxidoreductase (luciferase family) [Streptomyces sp. 3330]|nr:alkanesulfonate monooxygenase SsuD/methylene tetrahydromethanopterin reductase-like flavin-dependent oxidoreductase (luciferase family) [Streptomyces sp. 3330]
MVPVTYAEPFHVSGQLAFPDHISVGRGGWVVGEEERPEAARVWGRPHVVGEAARARASRDGVDVVRALWDSWEDDEPADLARRLSGLDLLSEGRAGWNVVTTDNAWPGVDFRRGGYLDHADRYRRAEEFLTVLRALWDGWADGAVSGTAAAPAWAALSWESAVTSG